MDETAAQHTDTAACAAEAPRAPEAAPPRPPAITLTEKAAAKVREIRAGEEIDENLGLRLRVLGGGCSGFSYDLYFDDAKDGDRTFDSHGVKVVCDLMSFQYLVGTEIDYVEELHASGFKFLNPNVKATCGCGSSFSA